MRKLLGLNILHILNDGFKASLLLFLPFIAIEFGISLTEVGLLGTTMNIFEVLFAIPAGMIAARIGGYKALALALFFYTIGYFLNSIAPHFFFFILAFVLAGIGFALFHPISFSIIAHNSEKSVRGRVLGDFTAIGDVGRVLISSIITFIIAYIGWRYTSFGSFILLACILYIVLIVKRNNNEKAYSQESLSNRIRYRDILKHKKFVLASVTYLIDCFASQSLFIFIPFMLLARGAKPEFLGILTSAFFVGNMFGKIALGRLVDKLGSGRTFIVSEIMMAIFLVILAQTNMMVITILTSVILGIFTKGTMPILTSMVAESAEHHEGYEKTFSLNAVFAGLGTGLSPLALGYVADHLGITSVFLVSAIFAVCATIPAYMFLRSR